MLRETEQLANKVEYLEFKNKKVVKSPKKQNSSKKLNLLNKKDNSL